MQSLTREAFFASILDSATDFAILAADGRGHITAWNTGAVNILGWAESEIIGQHAAIIFTPSDREAGVPEKEMMTAAATGRANDDRWHQRKDGTVFFASGSMMQLRDENTGAALGFIKILRDRTAQAEAAARLKASEERLKIALKASGTVGVWDWHVDADRLIADATVAKLCGVAADAAAAGLPLSAFAAAVHPADRARVEAQLQATLRGDGDYSCEYRVQGADGTVRWLLSSGALIRDDEGRPLRFPGVTIDITDRKRIEDERSVLAGELQHRIKNTLAVVQAIALQTFRTASTKEDAIRVYTDRLAALGRAHDVLTQTRWVAAGLREVLDAALAAHRGSERDSLAMSGPDVELPAGLVLSLTLVMHELATNASKYGAWSNNEGRVEIDWTVAPSPAGSAVKLAWREIGGPPVSPPTRRGFGTRLIERGLSGGNGAVALDYTAAGLVCTVTLDLPEGPVAGSPTLEVEEVEAAFR